MDGSQGWERSISVFPPCQCLNENFVNKCQMEEKFI